MEGAGVREGDGVEEIRFHLPCLVHIPSVHRCIFYVLVPVITDGIPTRDVDSTLPEAELVQREGTFVFAVRVSPQPQPWGLIFK